MKTLCIAIVGSRFYQPMYRVDDYLAGIREHFAKDYDEIRIVSGHADGPDFRAEERAESFGFTKLIFPIDTTGLPPWNQRVARKAEFTRRAYARNFLIADACDWLVAFWDGVSGGTLDAMRKAKQLGKRVVVVKPDGSRIEWNEG